MTRPIITKYIFLFRSSLNKSKSDKKLVKKVTKNETISKNTVKIKNEKDPNFPFLL